MGPQTFPEKLDFCTHPFYNYQAFYNYHAIINAQIKRAAQQKRRCMSRIVIIGAGLTGLSAAYHLEKKGYTNFTIFEKESSLGGLCGTKIQDGFTFDYTGHLLHINDPYLQELVQEKIGFDMFNSIERRSFIYSQDTYTPYPFQTNLYGLPTATIANCLQGYITRNTGIKKPKNFPEWVLKHFGTGFARYFFFPYQKKIFAHNLDSITASWTGRFVPSTTLEQIIEGSLRTPIHPNFTHTNSTQAYTQQAHAPATNANHAHTGHTNINTSTTPNKVGYNAQFFYPKQGGNISWIKKFASHIKTPINYNFTVQKIDCARKAIYFTNGHIEPFDQLITTMPLDILLGTLEEPASLNIKKARAQLLCNKVINFNLGIAKPNISDKHWIYFPETKFPFYRLGFPHNFSDTMAPAGHSSLYGEFAHINKSETWVKSKLTQSLACVKQLLNIADSDIATQLVIPISHAYVIYDAWRDKNLPKLLTKLADMNIYSVGRYGAWKYSSMQEGILDGKAIIDQLVPDPAADFVAIAPARANNQTQKTGEPRPACRKQKPKTPRKQL
jgi:protoporphyrinogen oxidase